MLTLETQRLIIRNFRPDDWEELLDLAIRYQASEYAQYDHPWPTTEEEVKGMAEWFAGGDNFFAVCLKTTSKLIGLLNIQRKEDAEGREHGLGYVFHPDYYRQGYATEACRAGMAQVFGPWKADRIHTGTHPNNTPSIGLLHKLGLKEVKDGEYAITRKEWLALET
jgi:RimJ/RimL family protein N-acetyltransferase